MNAIRIDALRSMAAVATLRTQIDALNLASRRPCPFSTFEYLETFLAHDEYGTREDELLFLAAFEGERLIGYLPLRKHRQSLFGVPFGRIGVLVSHDTDRPHVVARAEDERRVSQAFFRHLLERERGWSVLELAMQDAPSGLAEPPPASPLRFLARRFPNMPNSSLPLEGVRSVADFLSKVAHNERKSMRRLGRRLLTAGEIELVASSDARALPRLLDLYLDLERRSWKEAAHAGIRRDPHRVEMFQALCAEGQPLRLEVLLVLLDGVPIAGMLTGVFEGVQYGFETAFDDAYEDLSPGHLLMLAAVRRALEKGYRSMNLGGNYAYYKSRLGCVVTETFATQIFRTFTVPWAKAVVGEARRRLQKAGTEAQAFNPDRRAAVTEHEAARDDHPQRPARDAERDRAQSTLRALEADGVRLERLSGAALQALLPFMKGPFMKGKEAA